MSQYDFRQSVTESASPTFAGLTVTNNGTYGGTLDITGNIDPTTYDTANGGFLDDDTMAANAANKVASQQSIKAYVAAQASFTVPADTPTISRQAGGNNTWESADISSVVGSNVAMVMLKVESSANTNFACRSGTDSDLDPVLAGSNITGFDTTYVPTGKGRSFIVITNSSGIFQWKATTTTPSPGATGDAELRFIEVKEQ